MCGIVGRVGSSSFTEQAVRNALKAMHHRGPDASGFRVFRTDRTMTAIGSARLRIIDTSTAADQPIGNEDETVWVVFNGELYNFRELRADLTAAGHVFTTASDTECLVHLYEEVGGDEIELLSRLRGMFAFAIWDARQRRLVLARDRLGIKPVVWAAVNGGITFASEARTLAATGWVSGEPDRSAAVGYLQWGVVPGPATLIDGVEQLAPGHVLTWDADRGPQVRRWWSPVFATDDRLSDPAEAVRELRTSVVDAVARHLLADRPVGLFLSSGTDSRALAAVAVRHGLPRALTVTFPDSPAFDEGEGARQIAAHLGVRHDEVPIAGVDVAGAMHEILRAMDRPSADAVNTWLVCRAAHDAGLVVALSGLGGDELFAGYRSFSLTPRVLRARQFLTMVPPVLRQGISNSIARRWPGAPMSRVVNARPGMTGAYEAVRQLFGDDDLRAFGLSPTESRRAQDLPDNAANAVMLLELERYLADQLLPDTDSVSMAHSLEVRVPLLDDVVLATALAIPGAMRKSAGKQLLARATGLDRSSTKRTFTPPFATWIQGPLRDTVRGGLCSDELPFSDLIPSAMRQALWSQVEQGKGHWSRAWAVTVLRMWPAANGFRWD